VFLEIFYAQVRVTKMLFKTLGWSVFAEWNGTVPATGRILEIMWLPL